MLEKLCSGVRYRTVLCHAPKQQGKGIPMKIGFDNNKYLAMQSAHIRERISQFDNKLYLEFGGKLFDDYHASRVLPGFQPDSKLQMLLQLKAQAEIVVVISAEDIISNKMRGDYGITYDQDVLRLIDAFQGMGLFVGSVCITMYTAAPEVEAFERRLNELNIRTFRHYKIAGYPNDVTRIVSDDGYGKNDYIETERPLVVITAPGNDLVSATALTAAGAHMILFSTGRGTPFGAPAPTLKIATNSQLAAKKSTWIDFNAGVVADGEKTLDETGADLYQLVLDVASGKQTCAEKKGFREISIFKDGVVL